LTTAIFTHTKTSFQIIRENIFDSENTKRKDTVQKPLYYTEKNSHFVRVFFKILYTLFTFDFIIVKIPLYNTEKNSSFVDVFSEKFTNYFHAKRGLPQTVGQTSSFVLFIHQKSKDI